MPLDPQISAFLKELSALDTKAIDQCTPDEFRTMIRVGSEVAGQLEAVGQIEGREIEGPDGAIGIRIYRPVDSTAQGAVVYYHGGGWVGGDLDTHDALCRALANTASCMVVAVDYRLAPEHKYPAAAEDAYAAFTWVCEHSDELGIDSQKIAVCGDSAGGNLAAVVSLMARDRKHLLPKVQVLIYPITNFDFDTFSYAEYAEGYGLTTAGMKWFWQHYSPDESEAVEPYASPLNTDEFSGVSPAVVILAEYDVLRSEGEQYAARLQAANVSTVLKCYPGVIHGFVSRVNLFDAAREAVSQIAESLQKAFQT